MQRLPKLPGFRSLRVKSELIYTDQLDQFSGSVDNELLAEKQLVSSAYVNVKLLHRGEPTKKIAVKVQGASSGAIESIEKAGGSVEIIGQVGRPSQKDNSKNKK
jgi:large subunit ribosomal protein L15